MVGFHHLIKKVKNVNLFLTMEKQNYLASKHLIDFDERNSFPFIILRLYQVFGPKQKEDRLIPYVISSM